MAANQTSTPSSSSSSSPTLFPDFDKELIKYLTLGTAILSIIGSSLIIYTFLRSSLVRAKTLRKMLVVLSIFDLCSAIGYILMVTNSQLASRQDNVTCNILALVTIYFPIASFLATDGIALFAYITLVHKHPHRRDSCCSEHSNYVLPLFLAVSLSVPACVAIVVGVLNVEGYDPKFHTGTCWIYGGYSNEEKFAYQLLAGKGVEYISFVFVLCCYVPTVKKLHNVLQHTVATPQSAQIRQMLLRLALVPFVFICLRLPSAIHTVLMNFAPGQFNVQLITAAQVVGDTGQGAANGLLWVVFSDTIRKIFCRRGEEGEEGEDGEDWSREDRVSIGSGSPTSPPLEKRNLSSSTLTDPLVENGNQYYYGVEEQTADRRGATTDDVLSRSAREHSDW